MKARAILVARVSQGEYPTMKHSLRVVLLLCGLVGTFVVAAVTSGSAIEGGPLHCPTRAGCCRPSGC